jgi:hypothetical protein
VAHLRFSRCRGKASEGAVAGKPRGGDGGELEEGDDWWGGPAKDEWARRQMVYAKRKIRKKKNGKRPGCKAKWAKTRK